MKTWEPGAKRDWLQLALYLAALMAFGYLVGLTIAHWPAVTGWLVTKAPWWFLFVVGFAGLAVVVLAAAWRDLFPSPDSTRWVAQDHKHPRWRP